MTSHWVRSNTSDRATTPTPKHTGACPGADRRADSSTVTRGSKLDLMRMIGADMVQRMAQASDSDRMRYFMQLRGIQDQIVGIKHRQPLLASRPSNLAWVDNWRPNQSS